MTSDRTELAPLYSNLQDTSGLRIIVCFFSLFTVIVSISLISQIHDGYHEVVSHRMVVSDNKECSAVGLSAMDNGGNAVDAVIATLFCLSVVLPHLIGIGGGGAMIVYNHQQTKILGCLDFQPAVGLNNSIGTPGFVAGLFQAHKSFGKLPWSTLLSPAMEMAQSGFSPNESLLYALSLSRDQNISNLLSSGKNLELYHSLQAIAENGSNAFYHGSLSSQMIPYGITSNDLAQYQVVSGGCKQWKIGQYNIFVSGPKSGGPLLVELLTKLSEDKAQQPLLSTAFRLKETPVVSRPYTNGVTVVAADNKNNYVTVVSGLGSVLGSQQLTSGGYIMNSIFNDVHLEEGDHSEILASPVIVVESHNVCGHRFILGSNDFRDAAPLLASLISFGNNQSSTLQSISEAPRARILGDKILLENNHIPRLDDFQLKYLQQLNYTIGSSSQPYPSLNMIHILGDEVMKVVDSRGGNFF